VNDFYPYIVYSQPIDAVDADGVICAQATNRWGVMHANGLTNTGPIYSRTEANAVAASKKAASDRLQLNQEPK
jgi:hypothetical protein